METVIVTSAKDADKLEFGQPYIIDVGFNDPEHDVEEFSSAYAKVKAEVVEVLAKKFSGEPVDDEPVKTNQSKARKK